MLGGVGTTMENLETAIQGESHEFMTMYPGFIEHAKADKNQRAEIVFTHANAVEKIHHGLYQKALEGLKKGQQFKDETYFVCQVCGNTVAGEAPDRCPICGAPRSKFTRVE